MQLLDGGRTIDVAGHEQRLLVLLRLEHVGQLAAECRLTRTLQASHEDDGGALLQLQLRGLAAHAEFFFIHNHQKPFYCISHYVQVKTELIEEGNDSIIDDFQKNERNCIQKALCFVSTIPLFGNSILYQNFYTELINQMDKFMKQKSLNDKTNLDILYNRLLNLNNIHSDSWMFNLRKIYCYLKEDIFILIKLILLEKRIIVYSQIPSNVSLFIMALISLLPGEINQGLKQYEIQNGMPFKIFHDKYLIYPLFSLFDLDPLLNKISNNKNINFLIGTTNTIVSNSQKIVYSCKIDLDKPEIIYNKKN